MTTLWTAAALQAATNGAMPHPFDAAGVSIDSRTLRPGDLFIALQGTSDGHAHAAAALGKGAAGVLVSRAGTLPDDAPILLVDDTLDALTALGQAARTRFHGKLVAVTGSVGKTTTKEMLRTALSAFGSVHAAEASYNNHWGVPLTLARLPASAAYAVLEIGMNNPGEIAPLAALAHPHVAIITAIAAAHIGHLGSLEAIAEEKATLLDHLQPGGTAVIPNSYVMAGLDPATHADQHEQAVAATIRAHARDRTITFGPGGDASTTNTTATPASTHIEAQIAGTPVSVRLEAPGAHMVANALATLAAVHALGLDPRKAATALQSFTPAPGRGTRRTLPGDILLLDESYNASPASVRAALAVLHLQPASRRIAVLGDMLELGAFGPGEHAALAPSVAQAADLLYACGPLTRSLFDRVPTALQAHHADDAEALAPIVAAAVRPGDAVLVKGSLGSRMRLVVTALESAPPAQGSR